MCELAVCCIELAGVLQVELARGWMEKVASVGMFAFTCHVMFADIDIAFALLALALSFTFSLAFLGSF